MESKPSVHDNSVYAYVVDCESRRLTLHTEFVDKEPHEFTDVVFRNVVAHFFEHVLPSNILFDVEETDIESFVEANAATFVESSQWGWPPIEYGGELDVLKRALDEQAIRAFVIQSSYGLSGWVLAGSCERLPRTEKAMTG